MNSNCYYGQPPGGAFSFCFNFQVLFGVQFIINEFVDKIQLQQPKQADWKLIRWETDQMNYNKSWHSWYLKPAYFWYFFQGNRKHFLLKVNWTYFCLNKKSCSDFIYLYFLINTFSRHGDRESSHCFRSEWETKSIKTMSLNFIQLYLMKVLKVYSLNVRN